MFAPVDRYTDWHNDLMANVHFNSVFRINTREEQTFLDFADGTRIRWAWSNKYVPLEDFFLVDKVWARWIAKEVDGDRFQITVNPVHGKLDTIFKTVYKLSVEHSERVRRITPVRLAPSDTT